MSSTYSGTATAVTSITVLDDGDAPEAASIAPALEAHQDFIRGLEAGCIIKEGVWYYDNTTSAPYVCVQWTNVAWSLGSLGDGTFPSHTFPGLLSGDVVIVTFDFWTTSNACVGAAHELRLVVSEAGGALTAIPGARCFISSTALQQFSMSANHRVVADGQVVIAVEGQVGTIGEQLNLSRIGRMNAFVMRPHTALP